MTRLFKITLAVYATIALSGCQVLWDFENRSSLKKDVNELISKASVSADLRCHMIGTTRSGICEGGLSAAAVESIATQLNLTEVKKLDSSNYDLQVWLADGKSDLIEGLKTLRIYKSKRRASELRLKNGSNFEYLLLFFDATKKMVRIQVSYAYG
jgi:hypothetical protein